MTNTARFRNLVDGLHKYSDRLVCAVVHLNDTYLIEERPKRIPGFPRLIATIDELREHARCRKTGADRLLVVHSGDFLGPSRVGKADKGAAMVDLLDRSGLDYCVIGNHEFDYKAANLEKQLGKASFEALSCNVSIPSTIRSRNTALWPSAADPQVALTGVVSRSVHRSFDASWTFTRGTGALCEFSRRTSGVPFRVVLSHATREQDRILRKALGDAWRTIVLGGHDHHIHWAERDSRPPLYKNRSNLETVRVLLLLAGGDFAMQQLNDSYERIKTRLGSPPLFDAATVDALLEPLNACDAAVFRRWVHRPGNAAEPDGVGVGYFDDDPLPANALAHRLAGMRLLNDIWSHVLEYDDFLPPDAAAEKVVATAMAAVKQPGEDAILFDFSASTARLDARDEALRSRPTDFGLWVAECVRREAAADIAIVNAGAFRCDTYLEPAIAKRDLLDTFLYDEPGPGGELPVVVVKMTTQEVDALLQHGRLQLDQGGYPQVSDRRDPSKSEHVVAISSYLVLNEKSIDGYIEALARLHGRAEADVRADIRRGVLRQLGIVPSIVGHGGAVGYVAPPRVAVRQDPVSIFVTLARGASEAFDRMLPYGSVTHVAWQDAFRRMFTDPAMPLNPEVKHARDELVAFLREQRGRDIPRFMRDIRTHSANWADGVDYIAIFRAAVAGVPGLSTYSD